MKKPSPITKAAINYDDAAIWVAKKLGHKVSGDWKGNALRDIPNNDGKYLDYWDYLCDCALDSNSSTVLIGSWLLESGEEWQNKITQTFIDEFGDETSYWID